MGRAPRWLPHQQDPNAGIDDDDTDDNDDEDDNNDNASSNIPAAKKSKK